MNIILPPDRFDTPDFVIRSYFPGDGKLVAEAVNSSYEHLREFMEWAKPNQSAAESELMCRRNRAHYLLRDDFTLGIFDRDERRLLGGSGYHLRGRPFATKYGEIGMWIRADTAGRGLGTRVLTALLEWGFSAWPWERLEWRTDSRNAGSRRVAEKVGLTLEGVFRNDATPSGKRRDTLIYAAIRSQWKNGSGGSE